MHDIQIRTVLKQELGIQYCSGSDVFILDEVGLKHGAARIDILVVNGFLHGFEIKSDHDTLKRLDNQLKIYNSVLDQATLVTGDRYLDNALGVLPDWWGIKLAQMGPGVIHLTDVRKPLSNPSPDKLALAKLLWRSEALSFLEELGAAERLHSKPRAAIYTRLAEVVSFYSLHRRVCRQLKDRIGWRFDERRMSSGD